jgi:quinohemoprotein ethanol dehydrogenase
MNRLRRVAIVALFVEQTLSLSPGLAAQAGAGMTTFNWTLNNFDLSGHRYVTPTQITKDNVKTLVPRWMFQTGVIDGVSNQTTPIVVDGTMYVTDPRGSVYAVNAADGHFLWSYDVTDLIGGNAKDGYIFRHRGAVYADGVVYSAGGASLFALDAKTGKPVKTFGTGGQANPIMDVLKEVYPDVKSPISMGYSFTVSPQFYKGMLYIGANRSESHIPGGYMMAVDAKTGKVKWWFNTVPQSQFDQGWDIAGPTWVGGERNGGGIWGTPPIDPELGLLYFAAGNPFGDSKKRAGMNLFSDSVIALNLETGRMKWYFQETHHDVWDYDSAAAPTLFDMQVNGRPVKALSHGSKSGLMFILNRETGQPVHPVKEMPVSTDAEPGEHPFPTQPFQFTASGKLMEPLYDIPAIDIAPSQLAKGFKPVPLFTPPGPNQVRPSGGNNYGPTAYSPRTGLLYIPAIDTPTGSGRDPKGAFSAYDPTTGELKWRQKYDGYGQAGAVVTASDLVFVGAGSNTAGYFYAFDARTGEMLWKFNTGSGVFSSPSVYMVDGEEFVVVGSGGGERGRRGGDSILAFALPKPFAKP